MRQGDAARLDNRTAKAVEEGCEGRFECMVEMQRRREVCRLHCEKEERGCVNSEARRLRCEGERVRSCATTGQANYQA